jgi:hypothetical protein
MTPLSGRGALAGVGLWVALAFAVTFVVLSFGLFLMPGILLAVRRPADHVRRLAGEWCGVDIGIPYLRQPGGEDADGSRWPRPAGTGAT